MRRHKLNRFIAAVAEHLLLSLLWLAGCLPLITAPAATAALFEVTRQRHRDGEPASVRSFVAAARQYARPTLVIGLGWVALGGVLVADLMIVVRMSGPAGDALLVALLALVIVYAAISAALFPVLVSYHAPPREQLRAAALVAMVSPGRGLLSLAALAGATIAVWSAPLAVLAAPSLVATALQRLYQGAFDRLAQSAGTPALAGTP